jgi:vacuolar-type H+-ATPase catalytic subunit A/Vma1
MGFITNIIHAIRDKRKVYPFDEQDRNVSVEIRKQRAEISKKKAELELEVAKLETEKKKQELELEIAETKAALDDFYEDDTDTETDDPTNALMQMFLSKFMLNNQVTPNNTGTVDTLSVPVSSQVHLEDNQIKAIVKKVPKQYLKLAKEFNDTQLSNYIKGQIPNVDDDTILRTTRVLRGD